MLIVALFLVASVVAVLVWLVTRSSSGFKARIDAIKKAGYPVTAEDMDKIYPPLPDDKNSAIIYQKAFSQYVSPPPEATNWPIVSATPFPILSYPLPPDVRRGIADYLKRNQTILELLHQAAAIDKGYYDYGFTNGFARIVIPRRVPIRANGQILALAVILHAADQRPDLASQSLLDSFGLPRSLADDPLEISQIIRANILGLNCFSLEWALNQTTFSDDELRRILAAFHEAQNSQGIKQSLLCERTKVIWLQKELTANPFSRKNEPLSGKLKDLVFRIREYRESDFILYLDTIEEYLAAADKPFSERLTIGRQLSQKAEKISLKNNVLEVLFTYDVEQFFLDDAKPQTRMLLSETAIALERYRLANHNQLPATLQNLVPAYLPAVPDDPFDGKSLRYNRLPKGYLLYSVGEDGVDNGGKEWDADAKTGDITFTVER